MKHALPPLPYAEDALEPFLSAEAMRLHHGKHHRGYVDKLNQLITGTPFEGLPLEQVIRKSSGPIFNNAAQAWNHAFFWRCMTPDSHRIPRAVQDLVEREFGSIDRFQEEWVKAGSEVFGSGWVWLIGMGGKLKLETTGNGDNPLRQGRKALLACDLWEHAYYVDYRNERKRFLEGFVEAIHWNFVAKNLESEREVAA